ADVGGVEEPFGPFVRAAERLRAGLDRHHPAAGAEADARVAVVGHADQQRVQPGGVAVGHVLGLRVIVVAVGVPAVDVVGIAVAVVVETAAGKTLRDPALVHPAVAEDGDEVFGGQVRRARSLDVDGVQVLMLAAADAVAAGALHVDGQSAPSGDGGVGSYARGAGWVDPRVVHVVPDVDAAVAVEVVAGGPGQAGPVGALRAG